MWTLLADGSIDIKFVDYAWAGSLAELKKLKYPHFVTAGLYPPFVKSNEPVPTYADTEMIKRW